MLKYALIALLTSVSAQSFASGFDDCKSSFFGGSPPEVHAAGSRSLCFDSFAVLYSGISRAPIYSAERLNKNILEDAKGEERTNLFFADARIPAADRAELSDFAHSGFDRGHMAPAGDMPNQNAMAQSFSLANMVMQDPENNRKTWAGIEKSTRKYVMRAKGDVFVITGPVFNRNHKVSPSGRVWVPDHLFKLVYDPNTYRAWAYWVDNTSSAKVSTPISYDELVSRTGIEFLPLLKIKH